MQSMVRNVKTVGRLLLALLAAAAGGSAVVARPPDLPVSAEQECQPERQTDNSPTTDNGSVLPDSSDFGFPIITNTGPVDFSSLPPEMQQFYGEFLPALTQGAQPEGYGATLPCLFHQFWQDLTQRLQGGCFPRPMFHAMEPLNSSQPETVIIVPAFAPGSGFAGTPPCYTGVMPCGYTPPCPPGHPSCTSTMMPMPCPPAGMMPMPCPGTMMPWGPPGTVPAGPVPADMPVAPLMNGGLMVETPDSLQQLAEARHFYEMAEYYMRTGHVMAAYYYYQETHLHSPISLYGQVALQKLTQIEGQVVQAKIAAHQNAQSQAEPAGADAENSGTEPAHTPTANERYLQDLSQAQEMYHIGERCRARGDLDKAYACYHEVKRLCPDSDYARLASKQMRRIDVLRQVQSLQDEDNGDSTGNDEGNSQQTPEPASEESANPQQGGACGTTIQGTRVPGFDGSAEPPAPIQWWPLILPFLPDRSVPVYTSPEELPPPISEGDETAPAAGESNEPAAEVCPSRCGIGCRVIRNPVDQVTPVCDESRKSCREQMARALETSAWLMQTLRVLGGNTRVDVDVDSSDNQGLRARCGISFGVIGCQVIVEGDTIRVIWPTAHGME
jgi:hypothetical protein